MLSEFNLRINLFKIGIKNSVDILPFYSKKGRAGTDSVGFLIHSILKSASTRTKILAASELTILTMVQP